MTVRILDNNIDTLPAPAIAQCAKPGCGKYFALDAHQRSRLNRGITKLTFCSTDCSRTRGQPVLLWQCANPTCKRKFLLNASFAARYQGGHCCSNECANRFRGLQLETRRMDVPREAVCGNCGKTFALSRQKRFNYERGGQRNFFCNKQCSIANQRAMHLREAALKQFFPDRV